MKTSVQTHCYSLFGNLAKLKRNKILTLILMLAALPCSGWADTTWTGAVSQDWNNAGNWNNGLPSSGNRQINIAIATGNFPILTNTASAGWDIVIGGAADGRLDHTKGLLSTGNGNWFFLGFQGHQATYNLADTSTTGGAFTGFGQGSGSLNVGGSSQNGNFLLGLDNSTVSTMNINSSGTVAAGYLCVGGTGANSATFNLDNGTVNISGDAQIGGNQYGQNSGVNHLNISGGIFTANLIAFSRGNNNASTMQGIGNITAGGTLSSRTWFTLGFAGSSSAFAAVTNSGGTINVNTSGGGNMEMTVFDPVSAYFQQNSGALNLCNSAYIAFGNGGNNSGTTTFDQNGGTVTFYSDAATTVGGTGYLSLGRNGDSGTYTYNLNGGILTVPQIQYAATSGSGTFNFNGGTLKPTASTTTFMQGLTAANVMAGGAIIDTTGKNITIGQELVDGGGGGGLTKNGNGTLSLTGGCSYSGPTVVNAGTLAVDTTHLPDLNALTVSNASLNLSLDNGLTALLTGNITFQGNTVLNLDFGTTTSPYSPAIYANGYTVSNTGTNVINITGSHLVNGQYPLIYTGGSVPTNNFKLGTLPTGVIATLTNSGSSLDLLITASGQTLTWYGANGSGNPLTTWDINSSMNWNNGGAKYLQYATNSYGDNVTFDDTLYTASDANITLNSPVVPASVIFNNGSTPYSVTGSGGIGGATSLTISGSGSVFLGTSNSFSGGTVISAGTVVVTNDKALGASSGVVTLAGGTLQFSNSTASVRGISVTANSTIDVASNATAQLSGSVSGSATLTKAGNGMLTLAGNNAYTGPTTVSAGTLNVSGTVASTDITTVGNAAGNAVLISSGTLSQNKVNVGTVSNAVGAVYQIGGTVTATAAADATDFQIGDAVGAYGYYYAGNNSTLNVNEIGLGGEIAAGNGIMDINGATVNDAGWLVMARAGSVETGILNIYSGSVNYAGGGLVCNWGSGQTAIINVMGGSLATTANNEIGFLSGTGIVNLLGGVTTVNAINGAWNGSPTNGQVNFNGGTLRASGDNGNFLDVTAARIYGGGATIDNNGHAITIGQPLRAPTGNGVHGIASFTGGAGYIAPPIVTITGDGVGATAIAQIDRAAGTVTNIIITCPGVDYTAVPTFIVSGGGATTDATITGTSPTANTSGGLTAVGSGVTTLSGTNTYTGNTTVNAGTLEIVSAGLAASSTVSIASSAKLQLDFATTNQIGALVLNGVTQSAGIYNSNTTPASISGPGSLIVSAVGPGIFTSTPGITSFTLNGANIEISGTNGQAGDAYYLLASTNLSLPISQWQTVATNVLSASGSFTVTGTNVVSADDNQQFYILSNTNSNH